VRSGPPSRFAVEWIRLSRPSGWAQSKLPFIVGAALLLSPPSTSAWTVIGIAATIVAWAAFGFGLNEIADRSPDARAGRVNRAAGLPRPSWVIFLALNASAALGLSFLWAHDAVTAAFVLVGLALAVGYSVPPMRLKERGALGLLAAAAAQWTIPILAASGAEAGGWQDPAAWSMALLGFALGIRWIIVHQLEDAPADRRAGVRTFVSMGGDVRTLLMGVLAAELTLLGLSLGLMWPDSIPAVIALAVWLATIPLTTPQGPLQERLQSYRDAPLAGYYFVLFPVVMAVALRPVSPASVGLATLLLALGGAPYLRRAAQRFRATTPLLRRRFHHLERG
jgi:4-hydroxybenzoate polyprenyltransferase